MNAAAPRLPVRLLLAGLAALGGLGMVAGACAQVEPAGFEMIEIPAVVSGEVTPRAYLSRVPGRFIPPAHAQQTSRPAGNTDALKPAASSTVAPSFRATPNEPVVLALHGCGGLWSGRGGSLSKRYTDYRDWFHQRGFSMVLLDSFSPRKLPKGVCSLRTGDHTASPEQRRRDVELAMRWIKSQAWADTDRVLLLGWSHGGSTVLETMNMQKGWPEAVPTPRAAIAFYPGCGRIREQADYRLESPLLLMIGESDDWTPAQPCVAFHEQQSQRLRTAGHDPARFQFRLYPGAYHGFDSSQPLRVRHDVPRRNQAGVTSGGHPESKKDALQSMDAFLKPYF